MVARLGFGGLGEARGGVQGRRRGSQEARRVGNGGIGFRDRAPPVIYVEALGLSGFAGLPCSRAGPRAKSGRGLFVPCRAGPRAAASAHARHEAHVGPARARLIPCLARPMPDQKSCHGPVHDLGPDGKL